MLLEEQNTIENEKLDIQLNETQNLLVLVRNLMFYVFSIMVDWW